MRCLIYSGIASSFRLLNLTHPFCDEGYAMVVRLHSWWQNIRKPLDVVTMILLVALVFLVTMVIPGYLPHWGWTGLSQKTLWDWVQLLIIPAVLAVGGFALDSGPDQITGSCKASSESPTGIGAVERYALCQEPGSADGQLITPRGYKGSV